MKIDRKKAEAMLTACGLPNAAKLNDARLQGKLDKLADLVELDQIEDAKIKGYVQKCLKALESGEGLKLEGGTDEAAAPAAAATPAKGAAKGGKKAAATPAEGEPEEGSPAAKKAAEKAAKDAEKEEKAAKKAADKAARDAAKGPTMPGVRNTRSRPYLAGIIVKKHATAKGEGKLDLTCGITDEMVTELDEAYGKPNPVESMFTLRNAWHAIRGCVTKGNEGDLDEAGEE